MTNEVAKAVEECARAAKSAAPSLSGAPDTAIDAALESMADRLLAHRDAVLAANAEDIAKAEAGGMSAGLLDRLTITESRLTDMASSFGCSPVPLIRSGPWNCPRSTADCGSSSVADRSV